MTVFLDKKEYRTESYEIPIAAIREALVNAVLHRDYSNFGRDIKVGPLFRGRYKTSLFDPSFSSK